MASLSLRDSASVAQFLRGDRWLAGVTTNVNLGRVRRKYTPISDALGLSRV